MPASLRSGIRLALSWQAQLCRNCKRRHTVRRPASAIMASGTGPAAGEWINLRELQSRAKEVMYPMSYGYYASGATDMTTLRDNEDAFKQWKLRPRVLVNVSTVETKVTCCGTSLSAPLFIAPMAFHGLAHKDCELATARAAAAAGVGFCLSTCSNLALEEVVEAFPNRGPATPLYYQVYVMKDRRVTEALVRRAEKAGFTGIVLTVDTPQLGYREADVAARFTLPPGLTFGNLKGLMPQSEATAGLDNAAGSALSSWFASQIDASLNWEDVAWLRGLTRLPILLKGILTAEDAELAVAAGAAAVIVSNHGGRQLDGVPAAIDALPEVAAAVRGRIPVLVDGGFRRGTDVIVALALGATAVMIGRPILWGLALRGEEGVATVLQMLIRELQLSMRLAGCPSLRDVTRDRVRHATEVPLLGEARGHRQHQAARAKL